MKKKMRTIRFGLFRPFFLIKNSKISLVSCGGATGGAPRVYNGRSLWMLPARQIYKYTALSRFSSETQHSTNSRLAIASPNDPKIRAQNEDSWSCIVHRSLRFMAINLLPSSKNPRPLQGENHQFFVLPSFSLIFP